MNNVYNNFNELQNIDTVIENLNENLNNKNFEFDLKKSLCNEHKVRNNKTILTRIKNKFFK